MGRYNEAFEELRRTDDLAYGFFLVQTEAYVCRQKSSSSRSSIGWKMFHGKH